MEELGLMSASSPVSPSPTLSGERVPGAALAPHAALHAYFHTFAGDSAQEDQLKSIWEFAAKRAGSEDREKVLQEVTNLRHMLGTGKLGDKPWMKMMSYVVAVTDMKRSEQTIREITAY